MESQSPSTVIKRLEAQIRRILSKFDIYKMSRRERENIDDLHQSLIDARKYSLAYELSETREDQLHSAKEAKKWLKKAQADILAGSQADVFNAIDVAHLSAQIDQVMADLK